MLQAVVKSTEELFYKVREYLQPTPANAHYIFTFHDLARVISSVMLMSPRSKVKPKAKRLQQSGDSDHGSGKCRFILVSRG